MKMHLSFITSLNLILLFGFEVFLFPSQGKAQYDTTLAIDITYCDQEWMPDFGVTPVTFTATIWMKIGNDCYPPPPMAASIISFELTSNSFERGYCLNKGERGVADNATDLLIPMDDGGANAATFNIVDQINATCDFKNGPHIHVTKVETKVPCLSATVTVMAEDYGAYGKIKAEAPDCDPLEPTFMPGVTFCILGTAETEIPYDANGNHIAEAWDGDNSNGNSLKDWDGETEPNPTSPAGDGLSRYEEYRGFFIKGTHQRLGPVGGILRKDLFVYNSNEAYTDMINILALAADLHLITAEEMNCDPGNMGSTQDPPGLQGAININKNRRCINFNGGEANRVDQHGLWLFYDMTAGDRGDWGENWNADPAHPGVASAITVRITNITNACAKDIGNPFRYNSVGTRRDWARFFSTPSVGRRNEMISATIDHESGHAIGPNDHGSDLVDILHAPRWAADNSTWFSTNGSLNPPIRRFHNDMNGAGGSRTCPMRYEFPEIRTSIALVEQRLLSWRVYTTRDPFWGYSILPKLTDYCDPCKTMIRITDE